MIGSSFINDPMTLDQPLAPLGCQALSSEW